MLPENVAAFDIAEHLQAVDSLCPVTTTGSDKSERGYAAYTWQRSHAVTREAHAGRPAALGIAPHATHCRRSHVISTLFAAPRGGSNRCAGDRGRGLARS